MRALSMSIAIAAAACGGPEPEPRFRATCAPDPSHEFVTCTVENHGTGPGRACLTARLQPPDGGATIIARRVCVAAIPPGQSATTTPPFEQIEKARVRRTLASRCVKDGAWICKLDVIESQRQLGENLPAAR